MKSLTGFLSWVRIPLCAGAAGLNAAQFFFWMSMGDARTGFGYLFMALAMGLLTWMFVSDHESRRD